MLRRAAIVVVALALSPATLLAEDIVLTVDVESADIYKGPSTVMPVVGHASHGAVLPVSRNLGSWVRVSWPAAPDGVGYVHVTMGHVGPASAAGPVRAVAPAGSTAPATKAGASASPRSTAPVTRTIQQGGRTSVGEPVVANGQADAAPRSQPDTALRNQPTPAPRVQPNVPPRPQLFAPSHTVGIGALVGTTSTFGATGRVWPNNHLAIQFGLTRNAVTGLNAADRVTAMQFEPGALYSPFDLLSDSMWIRPYVGSTVSFRHETSSTATPVPVEATTNDGVGYRVFAGGELMFPSMPRFGLTADVGYRHWPTSMTGYDLSPLSIAIGAHWYIK